MSSVAFKTTDIDRRLGGKREAGVHSDKDPSPTGLADSAPSPLSGSLISRESPSVGHPQISPHGRHKTGTIRLVLVPGEAESFIASVERGVKRWGQESVFVCQGRKTIIFIEEEIHCTREIRRKDHKGLRLAKPISRCLQKITPEVRQDLL